MTILRKCRLSLPALLLIAVPTCASWIPIGPHGGTVLALAVDPGNSRVLFAGTFGSGLFKSVDAGETWTSVGPTGGGADFVRSLAIDASRPATAYAGTDAGIYKSDDGGAAWRLVQRYSSPFPDGGGARALLIDPRAPATVFASSRIGVYKSVDGGATWALKAAGLSPADRSVDALILDPAQPGVLYAGVGNSGLYRSADNGESWSRVSRGLPKPSRGGIVTALAASPSGTLYAGTYKGVFKSKDHGKSWGSAGTLPQLPLLSLLADPRSPRALFAGFAEGGVYRSGNDGAVWTPASAGLSDTTVFALVTAAEGGALYAGTAGGDRLGGVFTSTDRANTWRFTAKGITGLPVTALALDGPLTIWAVDPALGLFRSGDGGSSWSLAPLSKQPLFLADVVADPVRSGTVYASAQILGPAGEVLFKSTDAGGHWTRLRRPSAAANLELEPRSNTLLLLGQGLYRSSDGGGSWNPALGPFGGVFLNDAAFDPSSPAVMYAAGSFSASRLDPAAPRIFKSIDGGLTWVRSDAGLGPLGSIYRIVVLSSSPSTLFAIDSSAVFHSGNAGASWEKVFDVPAAAFISDLIVGPDDVLYAARSQGGVFSSRDGRSWSLVDEDTAALATALAFSAGPGGTLYAATPSRGLLALSSP